VPHPFAYGILVGSNAGGAGQQPLRYAEDDARRMSEVLKQLGRFGHADMRVLARPEPATVLATVDDVARKMKAHAQRGEQAVLVFYYSGHAKANAFSLGTEELPIATLRDKLRAIPSTLTLVVLDACQSGQFARVKGVEPAADFSFNSVARLTTKGIAVMASSSAQELSQESDELKGSYFTNALVTALRGAADSDGDGRVSLDEAYRYAYRRTLAATAQTQVGSQHVTLETDLSGQGDVPVTYPADARSQLELPGPLDAKVLVQHRASGNVVAEVHKAPGAPLRLAFASGGYEAFVRTAGKILDCKLTLADDRVTAIDLGGCTEVKKLGVAKGAGAGIGDGAPGADAPPSSRDANDDRALDRPWTAELGLGFISRVSDAYTRRLEEFDYHATNDVFPVPRVDAALSFGRALTHNVSLGVRAATLSGDVFQRDVAGGHDEFRWSAYGGSAYVRAQMVAVGASPGWTLALYGQAGAGVTFASTKLTTGGTGAPSETHADLEVGWLLEGDAGLEIRRGRSHFAYFLQGGYAYAPTMRALTGETHDVGGWSVQPVGLRLYF
jgi:hypothetical protein